MTMSTLISAIICTHNRAAYLAKAIQSLVDQNISSEKYDIIIVDNCSTDSTKSVVEQFVSRVNIRYLYEPNLGLSYARNTGWRNATGAYVAYLDDDAIACPSWLHKILEVFETVTPRPGCVGGKTDPLWEAPRPVWLSDELVTSLTVIDWFDTPQVVLDLAQTWLVGVNMAFPVEVLEHVGGFIVGLDRAGKRLLSSGDVFLQKQIMKAGYSCFYHPEMVVSHHIGRSRLEKRWFIRRYYWQGVSDAIMQCLEENPLTTRRLRLAITKTLGLFRSPSKLRHLVLPSTHPRHFTEKCFTLIKVGHIAGLLGAARRNRV
jgi:glycosyltransferase involved in cell wall biosynthesis